MSLEIPVTGIAGSTVYRLHRLPRYEDLVSFLASSAFPTSLRPFLEEHLNGVSGDSDVEAINSYYDSEIDRLINDLPATSPARVYLGLGRDFETIKRIALEHKESGKEFGEKGLQATLEAARGKLLYGQDLRTEILSKEDRITKQTELFGLISYLEEAYLAVLYRHLSQAGDYFRNVAVAKINTYSFMSAIKRTEKGQAKDHIMAHVLPIQGVSAITALKTFGFGDIIGEVGSFLEIPGNEISVARIESELLAREIRTVNKATYHGVADERIVQYAEQLYHLFANVKLAYFQKMFAGSEEETVLRMINYTQL